MNNEDKQKLIEIRKHLAELHDKWQKEVDSGGDGHCKSNEGYVGILYRLPNWFECDSKEEYQNAEPEFSMIEVYSYLFGPNRMHDFSSLEEAWKSIKEWSYDEEEVN